MRLKILAAVAALVLMVTAVEPVGAITFGQLDGNRHPNVGALVFEPTPGHKDWFCTGTLVAPTVFVTASHCTAYLESIGVAAHDVWVTFDPVFDAGAGTFVRGTYHTNPLYGAPGNADPHDVAVVVLDTAPAIAPAQLPPAGYLDGRSALTQRYTAVGYGGVRDTKVKGPQLIFYDGQRRFVSQAPKNVRTAWFALSMNPSTGNGGGCYGDSGGPHFAADTAIVVSVTVTGDFNCRATDVTYRIDTPASLAFIRSFIP